jgi:S-adenosylmethionine decarboxylase
LDKKYETRGTHYILDCYGVDSQTLDNLNELTLHMTKAIDLSGATMVGLQSHKFEPEGVTVLILLQESHMSLHSYPSENYCSLDAYTCGHVDPKIAIDYMIQYLNPEQTETTFIIRGVKGSRGVQL